MMSNFLKGKSAWVALSLVLASALLVFNATTPLKAQIASIHHSFADSKVAITNFMLAEHDGRKLNESNVNDAWVKLKTSMPNSVIASRIWSTDKNKVQVLLCVDITALKQTTPTAGILYNGVYHDGQVAWDCSFTIDEVSTASRGQFVKMLPQECRQPALDNFLTCSTRN